MHKSVLAIDGGGTKTAALVADALGQVRVLDPAQGCNPQDGPGWTDALSAVFAQVQDVDFAVIGMPGFGEVPQHDALVSDFINAQIGAAHLIINDVELAYRGAFPNGNGVLILAGTGSMAIGGSNDDVRRAGGWGPVFGDEGSAYWIGQRALAHAASKLDGRGPTDGFAARLTKALDAPTHRYGLLDWVAQSPNSRARVASVARVVDTLSQSGDGVARSILDAAANELVGLARAVSAQALPWCSAGSVFQSARIADAVSRDLGASVHPAATALIGGLHRAATQAGWPITPDWIARTK